MEAMKTYVLIGHLFSEEPLATCSKDLKDQGERDNGKNSPIPVPSMVTGAGKRLLYPATGIRSAVRRAFRDVVRNHVISHTGNETPLSLDDHYLNSLGGIKDDETLDRTSVTEEPRWRGLNPLLSVFGAGAAGHLGFVEGHLHVGNAILEEPCEPVIFAGSRTDEFYRDKSQIRFLSDDDVQLLIKRSQGNKVRADTDKELKKAAKALRLANVKGDQATIAECEALVASLESAVKEAGSKSGAGGVSVGMPLSGYQAIPMGMRMKHTFRLVLSNELELGGLLAALRQFALLPELGAHKGTGCGLVSGEWEVFDVLPTGKQSLGKVVLTPFEPLQLTTPELERAQQTFQRFLDSGAWNFGVPKAE